FLGAAWTLRSPASGTTQRASIYANNQLENSVAIGLKRPRSRTVPNRCLRSKRERHVIESGKRPGSCRRRLTALALRHGVRRAWRSRGLRLGGLHAAVLARARGLAAVHRAGADFAARDFAAVRAGGGEACPL